MKRKLYIIAYFWCTTGLLHYLPRDGKDEFFWLNLKMIHVFITMLMLLLLVTTANKSINDNAFTPITDLKKKYPLFMRIHFLFIGVNFSICMLLTMPLVAATIISVPVLALWGYVDYIDQKFNERLKKIKEKIAEMEEPGTSNDRNENL